MRGRSTQAVTPAARAAGALQGPASLLLAGRALVKCVDAPDAQRRGVLRRRGRENCVKEHQHEDTQSESAGAQPGRC